MATTLIDFPKLERTVANEIRRLAPLDLVDTPIYIGNAERLAAGAVTDPDCERVTAWTEPDLDEFLRPLCQWYGRGVGFAYFRSRVVSQEPEDVEFNFKMISLHEFSHVLSEGYLRWLHTEPAAHLSERRGTIVAIMAELSSEIPSPRERRIHLEGHDGKFIRVCCHLAFRAKVPVSHVFRGHTLHPSLYSTALGSEMERMRDCSMDDILTTPPPDEFLRVWAKDRERYENEKF